MSDRTAYTKGDLPGSRSGPCLGCGKRVVTARDAHVFFGGKRDGSFLIIWEAEPQRSYSTDPDRIGDDPDLYLLGLAHRVCGPLAKWRLEARLVALPDQLPTLLVDEEAGELPPLYLPPTGTCCAFCGALDLGEEHVIQKWISEELNTAGPLELKTPYRPRKVRTFPITALVCGTCNNRWLAVLEQDTKPLLESLIRGEGRTLSPEEQAQLATWAVKTAFMLDLASGEPVIPMGYYHELRQQRSALRSTVVLCGARHVSRSAVRLEHRGLHLGIAEDEPANGFVSTFTLFRLFFQVVGHFTKSETKFEDNRRFAAGLTWLWPSQGDAVSWPRDRLAFSDDALVELAAGIAS